MFNSSKLKKNVAFILYNVVVIALFVLAADFILGRWLHHPESIPDALVKPYREYYKLNVRNTIQLIPSCAQYDDELFYTLRPGECTFENIEFNNAYTINSLGTRDDEASVQYPSTVLLGDSFTMGWGVDQDSSYASLLEKMSGEPILNAGISSYGTVREMILLKRVSLDSLKTLVIQYHHSDLEENKEFFNNGNKLETSGRDVYDQASAFAQSNTENFFGKHTALMMKYMAKSFLGRLDKGPYEKDDNDARYFLNALKEIGNIPPSTQVYVFELASYGNAEDLFLERLQKEIAKNDYPDFIKSIKILNLQDHLSKDDYYILDDHIKSSGHLKIAKQLHEILKK